MNEPARRHADAAQVDLNAALAGGVDEETFKHLEDALANLERAIETFWEIEETT